MEPIEVVSSQLNSPDSIAVTTLLMEMAVGVSCSLLDVERFKCQSGALALTVVLCSKLSGHKYAVLYSFSALDGSPFFRRPIGCRGTVFP